MATLGARNLTLADVASRLDPDGKVPALVNLMSETNEILQDLVVKECNDGTKNQTTVVTGIPTPTWRKLYGGVLSTKGSTKQVMDSTGMLTCVPDVDAKLVDISGDKEGVLMSESMMHVEGMNQAMATALFYGDTDLDSEKFMGLAPRYDAYRRATPDNDYSDYNVFHGSGASTDNTSIWLVTWGDQFTHGLYPQGSKAGIQVGPAEVVWKGDDTNGVYKVYRRQIEWDLGLSVRDWRGNARICNIDMSNLEGESSAAGLIKLMIKASEAVKPGGRKVWYMHSRVRTMLRLQILTGAAYGLTFETVEGKKVMMFDGIPVRTCDNISLAESLVAQAS